jgi:signal transduction histidine kinase
VTVVLVPVLILAALVAVGASGAVAALAWRQRPTPGATALAAMMGAVVFWVTVRTVRVFASDLGGKLWLANLEWVAVGVTPACWLLFALGYTGREWVTTGTGGAALGTVPAIGVASVFASGGHRLVRTDLSTVQVGGVSLLKTTPGPLYWVMIGYSYLLVVVGAGLLVHAAASDRSRYSGQTATLLIAAFVPTVVSLPFVIGFIPVDPTPFVLPVSGVACLVAVSRYRLLEAQPLPSHLVRRAVVDRMDDAVVIVDAAGRVVDANPAARSLLSVPDGSPPAETVLPSGATLEPGRRTVRAETDAGVRWVDVRVTPLTETSDRLTGCVVVLRDVSERRRRAQRLSVLNRVVRHDLRNHMNVVLGMAREADTPESRAIERSAERLVRIGEEARAVQRLLDDPGADRGCVRVGPLLEDVAARGRRLDPAATVEVRTSVPDAATCDAGVRPALAALVDNAVEHSDRDTPHVELDAETEAGRLTVRVADDGPGIPEAERAALSQSEEGPLHHASGLGLWLVQWVVEALEGDVSFADRHPRGTVVTVTVPVTTEGDRPVEGGDPPEETGHPIAPEPSERRLR